MVTTAWMYAGLAVTAIYLIVLLALAEYGSRLTELSVSDYFVASGSLSSFVVFLTMIASAFSAFTFLGGGGIAYSSGISGIVLVGSVAFIDLPALVIIGERVWRMSKRGNDYVTPADLLCERFADSSSLRVLIALISIGFTVFYVTIQFTGMGLVLNVLTEGMISRELAAVIIGIVMAVYIAIGGMRGVAYSDALQAILIWVGLIVVSAYVLWTTPTSVFGRVSRTVEYANQLTMDPLYLYTAAVGFGLSQSVWPFIWQRYYSAKRVSGLWGMGFGSSLAAIGLLTFFPMIIAYAGLIAFPGLSNPDTVILQYILEMPGPLFGLLMAAAVAAAMSTADSMILMMGSIGARDVYSELVGTDYPEKTISRYSKVLSGIFGVVALGISLIDLGLLVEIAVSLAVPGYALLVPPALAAFFWPRANWQGAVSGLAAGLVVLIYYNVADAAVPFGLWVGVPGLVACTAVMIGASLVTEKPDQDRVQEFVYDLQDRELADLEGTYQERNEVQADD
ncbi:sodium:solute symporter family protein [Haloplanus rallus]|uniref:Sodium:solute symporter family protein n=1 Tax=Haloplanus rallus TaxID=1816183 RepID=A0A6B9F617_9EURY|nr:sodium:solute symporter family protein [Haloplanus rallus]QGX93857.1 sodium:solute symporter family protein [Haloplanus rallus]